MSQKDQQILHAANPIKWRKSFISSRLEIRHGQEQAVIVRFLNWATGGIERAIRIKRKIIALLNEQKQAIIQRAVTRGIDPTAFLRPSGIPWLGDIPKKWELKKLKYISPQITVGIVIQPARLYVSNGIACLRGINISGGHIDTNNMVYISPESHAANSKSEIYKGDIVIVRTGRAGVAVIVDEAHDRTNCIDLLIVRQSRALLSEYLLTYLQSSAARTDVEYYSVGAIQAHYNTATLANLRIPLPTVEEQHAILDRIADELIPVNAVLSRTHREIELLREYRTRLTADVVTGKLDVRGVEIPTSEETPEESVATGAGELDEVQEEGETVNEETYAD